MCTEADNSLAMYALGFFDDDDGAVIVHFAPAESAIAALDATRGIRRTLAAIYSLE